MAYNLECLIRIIEQILHPDQQRWILDHHKKPQIQFLLEKASSLKQILENSSPRKTESLEPQIRDAAHKAEDIIESHMVDQLLSKPRGEIFTLNPPHLQQVIDELDSTMDKLMKITNGMQKLDSSSPARVSLEPDPPSPGNILVGLDDDLLELKGRLKGESQKLEIIPITGMGGIGKTTLARNLYDDPLIVQHFDTRAWITISQDYDVVAILLGLLGCISGKLTHEMHLNKNVVGQFLRKKLYSRRYLIVLDDMWSSKAWDDIQYCFPDNNNGSRIVLTSRQSDVYNDSLRPNAKHQMHLLNESDSWKLLQRKVFGEEECPASLETIGKKIANNCRGLPLAVAVIGGLLSKAKRTEESWRLVAKDVKSILSEEDKDFSKILSLSYNHLPDHLKPCFLYMGAFPEKYEVKASKLIRLWIAEGFVKFIKCKSLEEAAASYIEALVSRSLILVQKRDSNGKPKSYSIHDCLRDVCIRKANHEKFLCVRSHKARQVLERSFASLRRVSANPSFCLRDVYDEKGSTPLARSFICIGLASREILSTVLFALRLLRVLDVFDVEFHEFPKEILQLVNLRYLAFSCNTYRIPSAISRLWNLQTLVLRSNIGFIDMPSQIWEMSELRHVNLKKTVIWIEHRYKRTMVQEKLQTISTTNLYGLIQSGFLGSIPNIRKLSICFDFSPSSVDLRHLHRLETLKVLANYRSALKFPHSITKLSLSECFLRSRFMTSIGLLPNLEVLKIRKSHFQGHEMRPTEAVWDPTSGEFCSLTFLLLENLNLVHWIADDSHFKKLRHLVIRGCSALKGIPCDIGDISTLEMIDLDECSRSAVDSAKWILKEQRYQGNDGLQVRISSSK